MKPLYFALVVVFFVLCLSACQTTNQTILNDYSDELDQKRTQLKAISESLPPPGSVTENSYCEEDDKYVAAVIMESQLIYPKPRLGDFYLTRRGGGAIEVDLLKVFQHQMDPSYSWDKFLEKNIEDDARFKQFLDETLSLEYLVVNRVVEHVPSELMSGENGFEFTPGRVALEGFVVSLEDSEILCQYHLAASIEEGQIDYEYDGRRVGLTEETSFVIGDLEDARESAEQALVYALRNSARREMELVLREITNGQFALATSNFDELIYDK